MTTSAQQLLDALQRAAASIDGPAIMASDGDNTLWKGDIGDALFLAALRERALKVDAAEALYAEAREHGIELVEREVHAAASALFEAYHAGRYPEARTFAMMAWVFAGWSETDLAAFCNRALDEMGFEEALRPELEPMRDWSRHSGVALWLVSASPLAMVREAARRMGLEHMVAMTPEVVDGVLRPRLGPEATYAEGKLRRLRAATDAKLLAAFGDSRYDAAMLRAAVVPVAVFPNAGLRAELESIDGALVLGEV
jgi:phosphoserine phosphatase